MAFATMSATAYGQDAPRARPKASGPAGPKDKAVLRLDNEALAKDYLETNFIRAEQKLTRAIDLCGPKSCSPGVLARLHRDLAVVQIAGLGKTDPGTAELRAAIKLDPDIALDPDYATPDLKAAFDRARGAKARPEPAKHTAAAGVDHTPVTEQLVATPIPIFARFDSSDSARVRLWYRAVGVDRWAHLDMTRGSSGFSAEIPCSADARAGDVAYFIEVLGEDDQTIDKHGSRSEPHVVTIVKELTGDAPHLPDASPPETCKNVCEGDACDGEAPKTKRPRNNWFVLTIEQDLQVIGAGTGVCSEAVQVDGSYSCFRASGSQYLGNPIADPGDNVNGGVAVGTTRIHVGYDRVLVAGLVLGVRVGYVVHGLGPRADGSNVNAPLPLHLEGRLAYWFGTDVFSTNGFRPYLFASGGLAQVDAHFSVDVHETPGAARSPAQIDNPAAQALDAYRRMGQGFVGGGVGIMYAFTPAVGLLLDAKYMHMLPTPGNVLSPEFGVAFGF